MKNTTKALLILWGMFILQFLIGTLVCVIANKYNFYNIYTGVSCIIGMLLTLPSVFILAVE